MLLNGGSMPLRVIRFTSVSCLVARLQLTSASAAVASSTDAAMYDVLPDSMRTLMRGTR